MDEERGYATRIEAKVKECRDLLDSMGGVSGPRSEEEYRTLFSQEQPENY